MTPEQLEESEMKLNKALEPYKMNSSDISKTFERAAELGGAFVIPPTEVDPE
jgi:hypothetical protein